MSCNREGSSRKSRKYKIAKRELDECTEQINKMQSYAEKALTAGNEADARSFLEKKQQLVTTQTALQQAYNVAADNASKMRQMHDKLVKDIDNLEARRAAIKATVKAAKAQERINKVGTSVTGANNSMEAFTRMEAKAGNHLYDISNAIDAYIRPFGYGIVRDLVGHGIGTSLHEDPQIPNFAQHRRGLKLQAGMTLAIEPMINIGRPDVAWLDDDWTVVTEDGSLSAHYENTILITDGEPEILTMY